MSQEEKGGGTVALIPLPDAAFRLRMSWKQAYKELLSGALRGERRGPRWYVYESEITPERTRRSNVDDRDGGALPTRTALDAAIRPEED